MAVENASEHIFAQKSAFKVIVDCWQIKSPHGTEKRLGMNFSFTHIPKASDNTVFHVLVNFIVTFAEQLYCWDK